MCSSGKEHTSREIHNLVSFQDPTEEKGVWLASIPGISQFQLFFWLLAQYAKTILDTASNQKLEAERPGNEASVVTFKDFMGFIN